MGTGKSNDSFDVTSLPAAAQARIEAERRRLQKASAVLTALIFAANHDAPDLDAADVASAVQMLIDQALCELDSVNLQKACAARNPDATIE